MSMWFITSYVRSAAKVEMIVHNFQLSIREGAERETPITTKI